MPGVDAAVGAVSDWGTSFPIMVAVQAPERDAVIQAVPLVKEALRSVPGAVDVTTSLDSGKPELKLVIDRKAAIWHTGTRGGQRTADDVAACFHQDFPPECVPVSPGEVVRSIEPCVSAIEEGQRS